MINNNAVLSSLNNLLLKDKRASAQNLQGLNYLKNQIKWLLAPQSRPTKVDIFLAEKHKLPLTLVVNYFGDIELAKQALSHYEKLVEIDKFLATWDVNHVATYALVLYLGEKLMWQEILEVDFEDFLLHYDTPVKIELDKHKLGFAPLHFSVDIFAHIGRILATINYEKIAIFMPDYDFDKTKVDPEELHWWKLQPISKNFGPLDFYFSQRPFMFLSEPKYRLKYEEYLRQIKEVAKLYYFTTK